MELDKLNLVPHRRLNPLRGEWVLVSPNRTQRPWQGQVDKSLAAKVASYESDCYLCPGNERVGGIRNPTYVSTFVFTNDFAALQAEVPAERFEEGQRGLLVSESEPGTCKVVCFSPRHDLTLSRMAPREIAGVIEVWIRECTELGRLPYVNYVQIFENHGEMMGCSNHHPHGQVWANKTIPNEPRREQDFQLAYSSKHNSCLLCDYLELERHIESRMVCENAHFLAVVPFWAVWPFETLLISKTHVRDLASLGQSAQSGLADILKRITTRYDNLFEIPFPYSMGFHQAPCDGDPHPEWHLHAHFYPPLLRSATVRKFMVGYEMLAAPQRDILPELAASRLREISEVHYTDRE